jgi:diguanylate cyclase (GGDEF)-like protein
MPDLQQTKNAELKASFIRLLPKRLGIVEQECHSLCHESWEIGALGDLYDEVQHLAGSAGNFGLLEISDCLFSIEVYLASFVDSGIAPTAEQISQLERLIQALMQTAQKTLPKVFDDATEEAAEKAPSEPAPPPKPTSTTQPKKTDSTATTPSSKSKSAEPRIGVLSAGESAMARLLRNLSEDESAAKQFHFHRIGDKWDFITAVERGHFDAIVVDTACLDEAGKIGESIRFLRQQRKQRLPALFLSQDNALPARLAAMRSGADAFLAEPGDNGIIVQRLQDLLAIEQQTPYQVLIVEDDRSQAIFCESILRKAGMTTRSVGDPLKAIEALDEFKPDVILMDLYMPTCDGAELTVLIRERPEFVSTPIVFLSGEKDKDRHLDALAHGGDDFLSKPIRPRHLISAVTIRARRARDLSERLARSNAGGSRDTVSGLHERGYLLDAINQACDNADGQNVFGGVLFVRLDGADDLRDRTGFMGLDDILSQLATTLASATDPNDVCARMTDTTFVVRRHGDDPALINAFAERLCHIVAEQGFDAGDTRVSVTVSVGVCHIRERGGDAGQLLNRVERAAAEAMKQGGNRVCEAVGPGTDGAAESPDERQHRLELLKRSLEDESLQLLFQPMVSLNDQSTEQYQTLLRLRDDATGHLIPASDFIPLAIDHNLIADLDRFVLDRALATLGEQHRRGKQVRLFISQSATSMVEPGRVAWLLEKLRYRQVPPQFLAIEVPCQQLQEAGARLPSRLRELHEQGVVISISNFNGGDETFEQIKKLPVAYVKAGAELVEELTGAQATSERFNAMVQAAHEHDYLVIAPMIESAASVIPLWAAGVDFIQGHFVQRPDSNMQFDFAASSF